MSRALLTLITAMLVAAPARADVEPPAKPTIFLAVGDGLGDSSEAVQTAVRAALPRVPRGFLVAVSDACSSGQKLLPRPASEADAIASAVTSAIACGTRGYSVRALRAARAGWTGRVSTPRHHIVLLSGTAPSLAEHGFATDTAVFDGFTVSFISLEKLRQAADRSGLQKRGAGRVHEVTPGASLAAALRAELSWGTLSKAQQQARAAALKAQEKRRATLDKVDKKALLKVLGGIGSPGSGGVVNVLGSGGSGGVLLGAGSGGRGLAGIGGLGIGASSKNPRLRRSESLMGSTLALTFRKVSCASTCDLADARRQLLASARPLLQCLEAAGMSLSGREEITVDFSSKGIVSGGRLPAERCVQAFLPKVAGGVSATLLVGPVSSVQ